MEPSNIRPDGTRPADISRRRGTGGGARDINMDVTIGTATQESCLSKATKSSDAVLLKREGVKWDDDKKSSYPLQNSATQQTFIPLALNHFGRRGPHFNALLNQFASQLISRPGGCRLLNGPFAQTKASAFGSILARWGARITWVVQREFSAQILRAFESSIAAAEFIKTFEAPVASGRTA